MRAERSLPLPAGLHPASFAKYQLRTADPGSPTDDRVPAAAAGGRRLGHLGNPAQTSAFAGVWFRSTVSREIAGRWHSARHSPCGCGRADPMRFSRRAPDRHVAAVDVVRMQANQQFEVIFILALAPVPSWIGSLSTLTSGVVHEAASGLHLHAPCRLAAAPPTR